MAAEGWTEQGCPYPPLWDLGLLSLQPVASVNIWDCAPTEGWWCESPDEAESILQSGFWVPGR